MERYYLEKQAMGIPTSSNHINMINGGITPTNTTMMTLMLPFWDTLLALTLGSCLACDSVYLCSIKVDGDSSDGNLLYSMEVDGDSSDGDPLCSMEVDGDSGDDDSVDRWSIELIFH